MTGEEAAGRTVIRIGGKDRDSFLQGLVTNDVRRLSSGAVYAALLTPQGKYLADFFLYPADGAILLDVASPLADGLCRRLMLYRLRADATIERTDLHVQRGLGPTPDGAFADPRHTALGWRRVSATEGTAPKVDWDAIRVAELVPESLVELLPDESYILEAGFERLNGVDFRKGCYVGQEVTARMKHKTELRKGFVRVAIAGEAGPGTPILSGDREAGRLFTRSGDRAIAFLRLDRGTDMLRAGSSEVALAEGQ